MAAPANTRISSGPTVTHEKEDLSDVIARIDPDETPVYSALKKKKASAIKHEWTVQELKTVNATNIQAEGNDAPYEVLNIPARMSNSLQIATRAGIVSGTYDALDTVGGERESTRQKLMKSIELRRDIEIIITQHENIKATDPRETASMSGYITNVDVGAGGAASSGDGVTALVPGTDGVWDTMEILDNVLEDCYKDGGKPKVLFMGPSLKRAFSRLPDASIGENRINMTAPVKEFEFVGSADVYLSDWGRLEVTPSIHMHAKSIYVIDPKWMCFCSLPGRLFMAEDLAKTGDARKFQVISEFTIEAHAPKAHGIVAAVTRA